MKVKKARLIRGEIALPGDKSISHRAAMLASISEGTCRLENFSQSADCLSTLRCLEALGVEIEKVNSSIFIKGVGKDGLKVSNKPLDCGNSGTTARLLSGILAGQTFESILIGDGSLSKRPMERIIEPLKQMGVFIESNANRLPLKIRGKRPLAPISFQMRIASAQVKSCVLLAGLFADGKTTVYEVVSDEGKPIKTRDHTERMLEYFGAKTERDDRSFSVYGASVLKARDFKIPCDISAAAFFLVAAYCLEGSRIKLPNVGINPTRKAIIEVLREIGAEISIKNQNEECGEPVADLYMNSNSSQKNHFITLKKELTASLIDELPVFAILGTQIAGLEVRNASELRVKESDRIALIVENLRRMEAEVEELRDGFRVYNSRLKATRIETAGDHRIAMAFTIAGLLAEGETIIDDADCVSVSFPNFFDVLKQITVE